MANPEPHFFDPFPYAGPIYIAFIFFELLYWQHRAEHEVRLLWALDRNHGGMLIIWDRLFATFEPEVAPVEYGLTRNVESYNPLWVQIHEYIGIVRDAWHASEWRDRTAYVVRGPGWSPTKVA